MARLILPILSDIHFERGNPILSRAGLIADAITSAETSANDFLILLAGDITWSASATEFESATSFLGALRARILDRRPQADVTFLSVPGNHDCNLPKDGIAYRKAKVESALHVMGSAQPDEFFVRDILQAQEEYWEFANKNTDSHASSGMDRLCSTYLYERPGICVQVNLLNSASLSQRDDIKGGLYLPTEYINANLKVDPNAQLAITVVHHWHGWIEPSNMIAVRQTLSGRSDMVITGHQHFDFSYVQRTNTGEEVAYYESPALFDKTATNASRFRTLILDFDEHQYCEYSFKWKDGIYRGSPPPAEGAWKPIIINRSAREAYTISAKYLSVLSDPGVAYIHSSRDEIVLSELFVYPDLRPSETAGDAPPEKLPGRKVVGSMADAGLILLQGSALSGKTALSKALYLDLSSLFGKVVIRLDGKAIDNLSADGLRGLISKCLKEQYAGADVDKYFQLDSRFRVVLIDDWHLSHLTDQQRVDCYAFLRGFCSSAVLFVDDLFQIKSVIGGASNAIAETNDAAIQSWEIVGLSHVGRGQLIANWKRMRQDSHLNPPETSREAKDSEDLVSNRLSKDSLPPFAFFILCMLQADENRNVGTTAGGSFGHLYEVLVTTALNKGRADTLLDKKFALLEEIAIELWRSRTSVLSRERIETIAEDYRAQKFVKLPVEKLLDDLVETRVLSYAEGHYKFAYEHFFLYFVARYIRDHMDDPKEASLQSTVDEMIDTVSSSQHSTVVMFLIYFASDRRHIIDRLVNNASSIYAETPEARLEVETRKFILPQELAAAPRIEEDPDIPTNRNRDRERRDSRSSEGDGAQTALHREAFSYRAELSDVKKFHLAEKNIEVLGQVVRNFTTRLPGELKVQVIKTTYQLGLRSLRRAFDIVGSELDEVIAKIEFEAMADNKGVFTKTQRDTLESMRGFLLMFSKVVSIHFFRQISSSVGVADMELAYAATLKSMDLSAAVRLVDLTIKMDHSPSFPEGEVQTLYESFEGNSFAQAICAWLVATHLIMVKVDRATRQRMAKLLNFDVKRLEAVIAATAEKRMN